MKLKKILSICLVGAMAATLLTACGSSDETVGEEIKDDVEEAAEDVKDVAEDVGEGVVDAVEDVGEDVKDAAEEAVEDVKENAGVTTSFEGFEQTITIKAMGLTLFDEDGLDEVVEAVNEISIPAINVELEYTVMGMAAYPEQLGLMFSGGESFDLMMAVPVNSARYATLLAQRELMDISPYVEEYAPEAMELLGDYVKPYWLDGALYGLPVYRIYTSDSYIIMRKDILDYLGLTEQAEAISSWTDLEAIFTAVYDAQDDLPEELQTPALVSNASSSGNIFSYAGYDVAADDFSEHTGFDYLGDPNIMIRADDGVVTCFYESQDFKDMLDMARRWYVNDWVYKDAATNADNGDTAMANGVAFCTIQNSEVGVESSKEKVTGYEVICIDCCPKPIQTSIATDWGWCVPVTAEEPEAAVAFLNLMYIDPDIENLFVFGIEGRDYVINDEGEALVLEDAVYQADDYMYPNQFNAYPSAGEGSDFREYSLENTLAGEISPYYGFNLNTDEIQNEIQALAAVKDQYFPGLISGTIDASETYDTFIDALYSAGLQTVIDFYQENLDEWLAEQ